ncbi:MAG: cold shock domain-containing protein [Methylobacter sp.]|jgi:cold shock CspA family protein
MTQPMIKGVLKTWKEDRGFGFIKPDNGKRDVFIHISSLKGASRRPVVGDIIYYQIAKDNRGKFKAVRAHIEGVAIIDDKVKAKTAGVHKIKIGFKELVAIILGLLIVAVVAVIIYAG